MKRIQLCLLLLTLLALLSSCAGPERLRQQETQTYTNAAGYHVQLPDDWQLLTEQEEASVFVAPDNSVSLTVFNELGGEAYYGLDEIIAMLTEQLPAQEQGWQSSRVVKDTEEERRQVFKGADEAGNDVYVDITVLQPHPGIRYYLMFAGGSAVHNAQSSLFGDIVNSFGLDEEVPYLYALMEDRRGEEALQDTEEDIEE